jgi:hypothetical protein
VNRSGKVSLPIDAVDGAVVFEDGLRVCVSAPSVAAEGGFRAGAVSAQVAGQHAFHGVRACEHRNATDRVALALARYDGEAARSGFRCHGSALPFVAQEPIDNRNRRRVCERVRGR